MRRFLLIFLIFLLNTAFALDIVYPAKSNCTVNAKSIFFMGNVKFEKELTVNDKPVKIWYGNIFVETFNLKEGENTFVFKSDGETKTYTITRSPVKKSSGKVSEYHEFPDNAILYTKTKDTRTAVREKAGKDARRVCDLPKDITLFAVGKKAGFLKLYTSNKKELWVSENSVDKKHFSFLSQITKSEIYSHRIYTDNYYDYIEFYLSMPVLYTVEPEGKHLKLTLYGVENRYKIDAKFYKQDYFPHLKVNNEGNNIEFYIENDKNWGYWAGYQNNRFIFKRRKAPEPDKHLPLANVNIAIDPGHGGSQLGSVGPTRINEKDINLSIAFKLSDILRERGANVFMTRLSDSDVGLYERVDKANENKAHIFVSIHANALPDGLNPMERHGTSVYYYNENAKELAEIIDKNLVSDMGLKDDGVRIGNFAVVRTTMPISVLVETAYMTYPPEYMLLQNNAFQKHVAYSIANSIETFVQSKRKAD